MVHAVAKLTTITMSTRHTRDILSVKVYTILDKLDSGLDESPTVMVRETTTTKSQIYFPDTGKAHVPFLLI